MKRIFLFCVLIQLGCAIASEKEIPTETLTIKNFRIKLDYADFELKNSKFSNLNGYWGFSKSKTINYIKAIKSFYNNKKKPVPLDVYIDLTDIKSTKLFQNGEMFLLEIKGGEQSSSYISRITFSNTGQALKREIWVPMFPEQTRQVTTYSHFDENSNL